MDMSWHAKPTQSHGLRAAHEVSRDASWTNPCPLSSAHQVLQDTKRAAERGCAHAAVYKSLIVLSVPYEA